MLASKLLRLFARRFVLLVGMSNHCLKFAQRLIAAVLSSSLVSSNFWSYPAAAQAITYCQLPAETKQEKEFLLQSALKGNKEAEDSYKALLSEHAEQLQQCRSRTWPQNQAIWLRVYPCDIRPGALDEIMDRIVNQG